MSQCYHCRALHYLSFIRLWQDLFCVGAINHFEGKGVSFFHQGWTTLFALYFEEHNITLFMCKFIMPDFLQGTRKRTLRMSLYFTFYFYYISTVSND